MTETPASTLAASGPFEASYTVTRIRFWRVSWHREALEVLAEATSPSAEADYLTYEWSLIQCGNRAEFDLRRAWALEQHGDDVWGWQLSPTWSSVAKLYGPHPERHRACLCKWLHGKPYPQTVSARGGAGDAGGRARRLLADLHWAEAQLPRQIHERNAEKEIARLLGWLPAREEPRAEVA